MLKPNLCLSKILQMQPEKLIWENGLNFVTLFQKGCKLKVKKLYQSKLIKIHFYAYKCCNGYR